MPSPGSHHNVLCFNPTTGLSNVWAVLEREGGRSQDTMCAVGISFPCHSHPHMNSFLPACEVQAAWGFGLSGGG